MEYRNAQTRSPSLVATVPWNGYLMSRSWPYASTRPIARADRLGRIVFEPEGQRQVEQGLGVGMARDLREERLVDGEDEVTPDLGNAIDEAVVHEQPAAVAERMAVGLLDRRPDGRPDMGEEQAGGDVSRSSRRFWSFQAGSTLRNTPGVTSVTYQPRPKPSPLVASAPSREWKL